VQLINGNMPNVPRIVLHHPVLSVAAGKKFMPYELARDGKLGAPYVVCCWRLRLAKLAAMVAHRNRRGRARGLLSAERVGTAENSQPE